MSIEFLIINTFISNIINIILLYIVDFNLTSSDTNIIVSFLLIFALGTLPLIIVFDYNLFKFLLLKMIRYDHRIDISFKLFNRNIYY